jgi:hypothetical protein
VVGWVRAQSGTSSLRALLYMDEVFGFLPPVAEPPSKRPLLTLLKQGRAYGLGVVLATQNPVDLDYKGLSNIGTWFLGRLQTQRDKERLLDGLEGVRGDLDRGELDRLLSSLDKRVFLAHNVHEEAPVLFRTRWAMSYLAGPLTREQIKRLCEGKKAASEAAAQRAPAVDAAPAESRPAAASAELPTASAPGGAAPLAAAASPPVLPPGVAQAFLLPAGGGGGAVYRPHLLGIARVHFVDDKRGIRHTEEAALLAGLGAPTDPDWHAARALELDAERDLLPQPPAGAAAFADPPPAATEAKRYSAWEKDLADVLYRSRRLELAAAESLGQVARPGESERDFRIRLGDAVREERDRALDELRERYARKITAQQERVVRAGDRVEREEEQAEDHKRRAWGGALTTGLGMLLGRKKVSVTNLRRAGSVLSGFSRTDREGADVERAGAALEREGEKLAEIEAELEAEAAELGSRLDPQTLELGTVTVKPRRADVEVRQVLLAWVPDDSVS